MRLASTLMLMFTLVNRHDLCHKSSKCVVGGLFWSLSLNPPSINLLCVPSVNVRCSTTQHQTMQAKGDEYSIAEFISQCSTFSKKKYFFEFLTLLYCNQGKSLEKCLFRQKLDALKGSFFALFF